VTYTDTTPNPAGNPEAMISFDSCREAIGLIQGTMQVENLLIRLNADGSGTFNAAWVEGASKFGVELLAILHACCCRPKTDHCSLAR